MQIHTNSGTSKAKPAHKKLYVQVMIAYRDSNLGKQATPPTYSTWYMGGMTVSIRLRNDINQTASKLQANHLAPMFLVVQTTNFSTITENATSPSSQASMATLTSISS